MSGLRRLAVFISVLWVCLVALIAAGVTDRLFDVMDLVKLLIEAESAKAA